MSSHELTRRSFLGAAAGAAVLLPSLPVAKSSYGALLLASDLYATTGPQRFVFSVANRGDYASGPPARISFRPPRGRFGEVLATTLYANGLPKKRGVYVTEAAFDTPGVWDARVEFRGKRVPLAFKVKDAPTAPIVGTPAVRAASPTKSNRLGVKPICTRTPPCSLHTASLTDVIGGGKPVAVLFATPALCQSRYCGPVLDELLKAKGAYTDRVEFVHVEIYKSMTGTTPTPTVSAWNLDSEPWLFGIDGTGTIQTRLDGAFGAVEIKKLLDQLVS